MKTYIKNKLKTGYEFLLLVLSSFIMFAGCEKSDQAQPLTQVSADNDLRSGPRGLPPYTMLVIEHNCMGSLLPDYNVYLRSDGSVTYHGWQNVAQKGIVEFKTDAATVSYIKNLFESANFFNIAQIPFQNGDPNIATTYFNRFRGKQLIDYDQGM
ncbi:MAG: DUF6438 domain-containing protein, partial [Bacteroidota bacterium]